MHNSKLTRIINRAGILTYEDANLMEKCIFEMDIVVETYFGETKALKWHWIKWHLLPQVRIFGYCGNSGDQSIENKHQDAVTFKRMTASSPTPGLKFELICDYFNMSEQPDFYLDCG